MTDHLFSAFQSYLDFIQLKLQRHKEHPKVEKHLTLFRHAVVELELLEKSNEFIQLEHETQKIRSSIVDGWHSCTNAIKNFFRRSGIYLNIIAGKTINIEQHYADYLEAFQKSEINVTYIIPLSFVHFNVDSLGFAVDCGTFQIRLFTGPELKELCQKEINEIFYPYANIQLNKLVYVPFVCITESVSTSRDRLFPWDEIDIVQMEFTRFPKPVEIVLKTLTLFNWQLDEYSDPRFPLSFRSEKTEEDKERYWQGFEVPFIITIDDNLLGFPRRGPDLSKLRMQPIFDPDTDEEIGEYPEAVFSFRNDEIDNLKDFIKRISSVQLRIE
jgi:hypothetical protein